MFQNNVNCDLYIGSGTGKMLKQDPESGFYK